MKKLLINVTIYSIIPQLPRVASFFLLPLYTKFLTSYDYGVSGLIYSVTGLFMGLGDLGLHIRLANSFFKSDKGWINTWRRIYTLLHAWSAVLSLVQSFVLYFILPAEVLESEKWIICLIYFICNTFFSTTINFCTRYYQYIESPKVIVSSSAFISIFSLVFNFIFIVYFKMGFMAWVYTHLISTFLNFLLAFHYFNRKLNFKPLSDFGKKWMKSNFKLSLPLIPHNYASYLLDASDRLVLKVLGVSVNKIGEYNFAYVFGSYFDFLVTAISLAISPGFAKDYFKSKKNRDVILLRKIVFVQCLLVVMAMIGTIWLKEIFSFIVDKNNPLKYTYDIAIIIIWAYSFRPIYWLVNCILTFNNSTGSLWKVTFTAGIGSIILNFLLIPFLGIYGAAWTTFISMIIMSVVGCFFSSFLRNFTIKVGRFAIASVIIATGLAFFSLWMAEQAILAKFYFSVIILIAVATYMWMKRHKLNTIFSPVRA